MVTIRNEFYSLKIYNREIITKKIVGLDFRRFIHPIVYGEYPKTVQEIVGDRLPKFTKEEVKMVKGSMDYVGINQYTTYYMYHPKPSKSNDLGYQQDWNAGFACKMFSSLYLRCLFEVAFIRSTYAHKRLC